MAQTNSVPAASSGLVPLAPVAPSRSSIGTGTGITNLVTPSGTNVANLGNVTVVGQLNQARSQILPSLGATAYTHTAEDIQAQSQGENAQLNQVILRSPGVALDSAVSGYLHVRGEHANLQYRIDDVLLPETIVGTFGLVLSPRFVQSMQLIDGSLPAQYGFRTAGIIDIQTKTGAFVNGGDVSVYGGSFNTFNPSFEYGDTVSNWDVYVNGSYNRNDLGIENPMNTASAIHDETEQYKTFGYASRILSDTSRLTLMGGAAYSTFQVPNDTNNVPATTTNGTAFYPLVSNANTNPADLNENQIEQEYFAMAAYQQSMGDFDYQLAAYGQISGVHFMPDPVGDLVFNGVATDVNRDLYSGGFEFDSSYELNDNHTIRAGAMVLEEYLTDKSITTVFNVSTNATTTIPPIPAGTPSGPAFPITQSSTPNALFAGAYAQDEWKVLPHITLNYGLRFDEYDSSYDKENQPSPRVNLIYQPTDWTTMHIGYSRYFTPPPLESIPATDIKAFNGTSNQSTVQQDSPVKSERANYFDAGISQKIMKNLQLGVDGYYKNAENQLDDGLFGQSLILQSFNYNEGRVYGVEFTGSYDYDGFSSYANFAWSVAQGKGAASAQYLWPDYATLNYVNSHWIYLDHDQRFSGTVGESYLWNQTEKSTALFYVDAIVGSGLREDGGGNIPGTTEPIPNGASVGTYYTINLGAQENFKIPHNRILEARVDVVNVTDNQYELRSGTGVGVNAPQWGMRRGFFGSLTLVF